MALLLNRETIQGLLNMSDTIALLESAFSDLASGEAAMPPRTVMADPRQQRLVRFHARSHQGHGHNRN